ncbi:hypothetical protein EJB05_07596, partial [Eragrostis curvula]
MRISLLFIVAFAVAVYMVATPTTAGGQWSPIPTQYIDDPRIQELGEWAVKQHNKERNDVLKFSRVVSGDGQVVSGVNYRLIIETKDPDGKYVAVLFEQVWTHIRVLNSFNPAT